MIGQGCGHTEPARHRDHLAAADPLGQAHGGSVDRAGERALQGQRWRIGIVEVARLPAGDRDRPAADLVLRPEARLERCQVQEQLERRARLAARLGHAVELAGPVGAAADHRPDPAVRRHRHQSALIDPQRRAIARQEALQAVVGEPLEQRVERGLDGHPGGGGPLIEPALARHPIGEIAAVVAGGRRRDRGWPALGELSIGPADEARLDHPVEHQGGAAMRGREIAVRGVVRGCPDQAGQERRLGQAQIARRLGEVAPRRCLDAIGAAAQIDAVEIGRQDGRLVVPELEPKGVAGLLELPGEAALRRQEGELGQLLADRAAALDDPPGQQIAPGGAADADQIDAAMPVEPAILDRDHGIRQPWAHLGQGQGAAWPGLGVQPHAMGIEQDQLGARGLGIEGLQVGRQRRPAGDQADAEADHQQQAERQPAPPRPAPSRAPAPAGRPGDARRRHGRSARQAQAGHVRPSCAH